MPTEVLVMCTRCGRPQPAHPGNCMACGEVLPEAPLPAAPEVPFLQLEGTGGSSVTGVDRKLTYRAGASAAPVVVELDTVESAALARSSPLWAFLLLLAGIALGFLVPSLRLVAGGLVGLAILLLGLGRHYSVVLRMKEGRRLEWRLGWTWIGASRIGSIEEAWSSGAPALASRGVAVHDGAGSSGTGARP